VTFEKKVADLRGVGQNVNPVATSAVESRAPLVVDEEDAALTLKWHVGTGPGPRGFSNNLALAFSPDGTLRASDDFAKRTVVVRDEASGREVLTFRGHSGSKKDPVYSLAFSPDGKRVASGCLSGKVKVWDATSGEETLTLAGHTPIARTYFAMVESVAFSPDGKRLASASADGTVKVWDTTSGLETLTLKRPVRYVDFVLCVAFSPDGTRIASIHRDGSVRVWDAASGEETLTLKGRFANTRVMAFSRDGKRLATCRFDGWVTVWDATSGEKMLSLTGGPKGYYKVWSLAFSPDGTRLASATHDRTVTVWDVTPRSADDMAPKKP
jgi:WD40 repeat protein